ncbi:MAG: hypothetical protein IJ572_02235 [Bacilli bacterium]|nr:hypothetical protein [Bacilli bacterium]
MNKSLETIKEIYKPYRYTLKGSATILETTSVNYVIKESNNNLRELFSYLKSRSFDNYPEIVDDSRKGIDVFKYIDDISYPNEQRANDLINLIAKLHYKTSFYKDVTEDNFKEVYDNIKSNIDYLNEIYDKYYDDFFKSIYLSPSKYLFMNNYSKIKANLNFCQNELDNWYSLVKKLKKTRVAVIHNNLSLDHFLKDTKDYLISWNKSTIDIPIIDIIKFYKKEYFNINFDNLIKNYLNIYSLSDDEKKLFFVLISLPNEIKFDENEFLSSIKVRENLDYIFKTENLIRPYYLENQKEE